MFGKLHLIYLAISTILLISLFILFIKNKNEERARRIRFCLGVTLFLLVIVNRCSSVFYNHIFDVPVDKPKPVHILPNTWCSTNALILSIYLMFDIKHHSIAFPIFLGLYGGLIASIIPTYLNKQPFFELDTITSLIFHNVMILACLTLICTCYYKPKKLDFLYFLLGMVFLECVGYVQIKFLGYKEAMQIHQPFFPSNPVAAILTGPEVIIVAATFSIAIFCFVMNKVQNKKEKEQISENNALNIAKID